ncbi:PspA/IM30 family protein [Falsarthrobacter nasiphocae]|uniref:Phage shock protein A n=1 Tax=Falsarthrobacter nasiphocae TaxID=189863 RepID=A0AAE3YFY4_9MICC|nr:PspA/IM30 family protein [Falsarthrobacter nasiphocae]MDR6891439.1 phage shock protein A [Falsarthrobacter nasiphocae]
MVKQSIFGRIAQLTRANINALLDQAEDPQKMLDQMVRDYRNNIAEAEQAVAQTIGNLRMLEKDHAEDVEAARSWGAKALAASRQADTFRAQGNSADAEKFDNLAKVALQRQIQSEGEAKAVEPTIASQQEVVASLKKGLDGMRGKLGELEAKRNQLVARAKVADAQSKVTDAMKGIDMMDPTSEISRFEEKVRREEARVMGQQELQASSIDAQFNQLEDLGEMTEIEARLAALKAGTTEAPRAISGGDASAADQLSIDYSKGQEQH